MDLESKIALKFNTYHGEETFIFTKDEILQIATMPAKNKNAEYKISLQNNTFFAIRYMNKFQYYYKSGNGTRSSTTIYYFPNIAKKIFEIINEPVLLDENKNYSIISISE